MRNVEEVRLVRNPEKHYALSLEQEHKIIKQAAVGVLSLRRAPKLGKLLVCFASICSRSPPPAEPKGARSAGPIGVVDQFPRHPLARQVGGVEIV